ncbi:MAG: hypothetical protein CBC29_10160 [Methylococcaceae bacterium TMED69]|nr:MAG: hypothetical protein CBC29_10160 [Methylococcaceae bacterium TMED69]
MKTQSLSLKMQFIQLIQAYRFSLHLVFVPLLILAVECRDLFILGVPFFGYLLIPFIDLLLKKYQANGLTTGDVKEKLSLTLIQLWPFIQLTLLVYCIHSISNRATLLPAEFIAIAAITGIITGSIGITFAHELMHKKSNRERWLADILMGLVLYGHFRSEHLLVHHRYVGTPRDAATAKLNESFFEFLLRVIPGCFLSAWNEEKTRLDKSGMRFYSLKNPFWRYFGLALFFTAIAGSLGGALGVLFFILQSIVAIIHLELANYIEHYGLRRKSIGANKFESTKTHHSWNSSGIASNWLLINLQLHSDHHAKSNRGFLDLQDHPESQAPQLPFGYPVMILLSLIPPIWFKIMNPRVAAWEKRFY